MKKTLWIILALLSSMIAQEEQTPKEENQQTQQSLSKAQIKSGFLIGIEALIGSSSTHEENHSQTSSIFSLMGGLYGGYQHYFDDDFGIRALLSIHDGTPITGELTVANQMIQTFALPFWVGTELDILWDFWQEGEHVLGISAGLGYNFEIYHAREAKINDTAYSIPNLFQHNLYPILGIHYYYGHHQMSLNYRFIGSFNSSLEEYFIANIPFKTKYTFKDYLNFSYTYRF
ncbi:hypothetical protein [Helicobacter pametensis]|uniref:hypothetical protein n=1 Tax=Helicobacter pametensis TaxID=95149 RepID=UPI000489735B|nr:hypothetical protein [Helicobacter pametensis]